MTDEYSKHHTALESFVGSLTPLNLDSLVHSVSKPFDISTEYSTTMPNNEFAGAYLFFSESMDLLYVGKSSLLGKRMNCHFHYSSNPNVGTPVTKESEGTRYIITIGLREEYAWLAPALEEFLIMRLKPLRNKIGNY